MLGPKCAPLKTRLGQLSGEFETSLNLGPAAVVSASSGNPN
jgi:hypothetical protein